MHRLFRLVFFVALIFLTGNMLSLSATVIEDFDSGDIKLISYEDRDNDPDSWIADSTNTYGNSSHSLKLYGDTWKLLEIDPYQITEKTVWRVASYVERLGGIHAFGVTDGTNVLMYSFAGREMLDIEEWITTYQGFRPNDQWNLYKLPLGDDWQAWHRYLPEINGLIFINDNEQYDPAGIVYFDQIIDITDQIPVSPRVHIAYEAGIPFVNEDGDSSLAVSFRSSVSDPNYNRHSYYWDFGDGNISREKEPSHNYIIAADYDYTAFLAVENSAGKWGYGSVQVKVPDSKENDLPLTMNFVGDVILARRYEQPGGIIPMLGVEAIFKPTLDVLGNAADLTIINLEAPLTTSNDRHPTKGICFAGKPENVKGLEYGGVDVASLANNHILDYMLPGLRETQQVLEDAGVLHLGAGANSYEAYLPAFVNKKGINVAFVASSDRTGQYNNYQPYLDAGYDRPGFAMMTPYYVRKQIRSVRDYSDLVVALLHSGSEYSREPISHYDVDFWAYHSEREPYYPEIGLSVAPLDSPKMWDRDIRQFMVRSGADLIINHHPHIIQGLELYQGKLIAHSLGNFIFDSYFPETMPSMILNAEADKEGFHSFSVTPIFIDDFIPQVATGELALYLLDYLAARSKELGTYLHVDREKERAYVIMDTLHIDYYDIEEEGVLLFEKDMEEEMYYSDPMRFSRLSHPTVFHHIKPYSDYKYRLGRELLWYGNFENEGSTLWNTDIPGVKFDKETVYQGERSLRLTSEPGSGSFYANKQERVRIFKPQRDFTLQGFIKTENAQDVNIEIRFYRTRWATPFLGSDTITVPISGDMDWTYFYKHLEVPENTRTADIFFRVSQPDSGTGYAWFDNVSMVEWQEWDEYYNNMEIISPNEFYYLQMKTESPNEVAFVNYSERVYEQGFPPTSVADEQMLTSFPAQLQSNFPNPFNNETTISFHAKQAGKAEINIFNIKGQRVTTLFSEYVESQQQITTVWNGTDNRERELATGVYFYQLKLDDKVIDTKKCLLLK